MCGNVEMDSMEFVRAGHVYRLPQAYKPREIVMVVFIG